MSLVDRIFHASPPATRRSRWWTLVALTALIACNREAGGHSHAHGADEHAEHDEEAEPLAITQWTDRHELFVEFPAPVAGKPTRFHAHVTRLDGFQAVVQGMFSVRFMRGQDVVAQGSINGVARPGIFTPETAAPPEGSYTVEMIYDVEGVKDVFDCGTVVVGDVPPKPQEAPPSSAITFLKESQWKIPFATAWSVERELAGEVELPAVVETASSAQLGVSAPVAGRLFFAPGVSIVEGTRVTQGMLLGTLVPVITGEDLGQLQASVDELEVTREQVTREVTRLKDMLEKGLTNQQAVVDASNRAEANQIRLRAAQQRLARVVSPGQEGGVSIRSPLNGIVSQVLVKNGQTVTAGTALLHVVDTRRVVLRARFVAKPGLGSTAATPTALRLPDGQRMDLAAYQPRFLSAAPVIDAQTRIASWSVELKEAPLPVLLGSNVVLVVRSGAPATVVAFPRTAVVDINTRPFVFVQVEGEAFEKRPVVTGILDGDWVQVLSGVTKNERVVTRGGFDIHLGALMGTIESHRH